MSVETRVKLKLCIWRDFVPGRRLGSWDEKENTHRIAGSESDLQEEVYSWHLWEDFRSGIADDEARRSLEEQLHRLDPSRPPSERRLGVLDDFIAKLGKPSNPAWRNFLPSRIRPSVTRTRQTQSMRSWR